MNGMSGKMSGSAGVGYWWYIHKEERKEGYIHMGQDVGAWQARQQDGGWLW